MVIWNLLHTLSPYANRWGGPRYRTTELLKFVNKHLYDIQIKNLLSGKKVNTSLASEAVLSATHTPYYMKSLQMKKKNVDLYEIEDELGFKAIFPKGTMILVYYPTEYGHFAYAPIETIKVGEERIINFEVVEELKNDKLHHHTKFSENFYKIKCKSDSEVQTVLCDSLTSMILARVDNKKNVERIDMFNSENKQQLYLVKITSVKKLEIKASATYEAIFSDFSYVLIKDRKNSNKTENRYYKGIKKTLPKKYLEKMRSRVFAMKKDVIEFEMELLKEKRHGMG